MRDQLEPAQVAILMEKTFGDDIHRRPGISRRRSAFRGRNRGHRGRRGRWRRETLQPRDDAAVQPPRRGPLPACGTDKLAAAQVYLPIVPAATGTDAEVAQLPAKDFHRADAEIYCGQGQ